MKITMLIFFAFSLMAGSAAQAQSSVGLYGLMDVGPIKYKLSGRGFGGNTSRNTVDSAGMTTSYIGFRGKEDLGGGLNAVFSLESYIRPDTGESGRFGTTDTFWKRNSFVGLDDSKLGRLVLGRTGVPIFTTVAAFNPFGNSFRFSPIIANLYSTDLTGVGINSSRSANIVNDSAWSNAIAYSTPIIGKGFQGNAIYSLASGSNAVETPDRSGRAWSVGGHYLPTGPLSASISYQKVSNLASGAASAIDNQQAWLTAIAYDFAVVKLFAQYGQIKTVVTAVGTDKDNLWQLGATVPILKGSLLASYSGVNMSAQGGSVADRTRKSWAIGYDYPLSKRTDVYLAYSDYRVGATTVGNRGEKEEQTAGVGIRHRF